MENRKERGDRSVLSNTRTFCNKTSLQDIDHSANISCKVAIPPPPFAHFTSDSALVSVCVCHAKDRGFESHRRTPGEKSGRPH